MTVDDIMSSIWGELPISAKFTSLQNSSSAQHSTARLENPRDQYCVGETLNVMVEMRDYEGRPKKQGGDFILARIHSSNLQASSSGYVTDLLNGSYRVSFTLFWPGDLRGVHLLGKISSHNNGKINYTGTFIDGNKTEESQCGIRLDTDKALCEYRKKEDGEYYACIKPQTLPCSSLQTMSSKNIQSQITVNETELLAQVPAGEGRSDVVVVIGVGQHFRPFPLEIFIQRLINIRQAILRLQARSPRALVVIKLENTRELSSTMTHLSDWFGHVQNLAQRKVFGDLRVALVDAWEMSIAADAFATHPNNIVVAREIAVALSHICHYGGLKL
ncbi:hypothetical protein JZ751_022047 [Albula glossodonta]|uniref:NXPE C-terminal domain-containing protein n=1 Tax=Albula glossodonta TaxID=121402 RepID=A0A8T2NM68_9TELE|nr:hypothetical protein JZ751_022047 [Albula glossodonta]